MAAIITAVLVVVVGTTIIPTHVALGGGSLRCGTVWHPDRGSEIAGWARLCDRAAAEHLRVSLGVGGFLAVLALVPLLFGRVRSAGVRRMLCALWGIGFVAATFAAVAWLGWGVEYSPPSVTFDL
jgi:hypothetical protein